jgi:hypothetical protein
LIAAAPEDEGQNQAANSDANTCRTAAGTSASGLNFGESIDERPGLHGSRRQACQRTPGDSGIVVFMAMSYDALFVGMGVSAVQRLICFHAAYYLSKIERKQGVLKKSFSLGLELL